MGEYEEFMLKEKTKDLHDKQMESKYRLHGIKTDHEFMKLMNQPNQITRKTKTPKRRRKVIRRKALVLMI